MGSCVAVCGDGDAVLQFHQVQKHVVRHGVEMSVYSNALASKVCKNCLRNRPSGYM